MRSDAEEQAGQEAKKMRGKKNRRKGKTEIETFASAFGLELLLACWLTMVSCTSGKIASDAKIQNPSPKKRKNKVS